MKAIALAIAAIALSAGIPVAAQNAPTGTVTAEEVIADAKAAYGPPDTRRQRAADCPPPKPGEAIVVCGRPAEDPDRYRVEGSESDGTEGDPRAPNVETQYNHSGVGVTFQGCFIPPCPPPMPLIIDLAAIPEAPPGSDADRAARGLAPARGRSEENGVTPPG